MTSISDNSSYGNELVLKGNSKEATQVQEKKVTFKNQIRPSGTNAIRAGDRFGSVLDFHSNTLLVGTANHQYDAAGASPLANAGAAWLFEKTLKYVARNSKQKTRQKQTFSSTGSNQTFTVPENVDRITVQMIAGGGGGNTIGTFRGGDGAYVRATILVNPGQTYNVIVGQGGTAGGTTSAFGGGGYLTTTGGIGGSGGGRSAISHPYFGDLITAGAGGGAGKDGPGGFGGVVGGDGVTNKTVTHPIDYPVNMKGAKGYIYGYCEAANRYANYVLVGSTYDLRSMVSDNTYMDNKHQGGNASPATVVPGNDFANGAGGGGFAGGGAGPDGYGYRSAYNTALTYYNVGGSGSGGSSMIDPTPGFYPMITDEQMIYDVTAYDGGKLKVGNEFDGYGVGGTDTVPGCDGIVIIEWDEITQSDDVDAEELWTWTQTKKLVPTGTNARAAQDLFGTSVAVYGDWAAVGAPGHSYDASGANSLTGAGAVYLYQRVSGVWNQVQKLVGSGTNGRNAGDNFGTAVAFANGRLFVGAPGNAYDSTGVNSVTGAGAVFVYELNASTWVLSTRLTANGVNSRVASDNFGYKLSAYSNSIAISSKNGYDSAGSALTAGAGTVFVFENSGAWAQTARLTGLPVASSAFGSSVSIKDTLLSVEASGNSTKYVFEKVEGAWTLNMNLSDSSVSNIVMYSRFSTTVSNYQAGINGVNMTFVNRNSSSYWDNSYSNDRAYATVSTSLMASFYAYIRLTGKAFANLPNFTFEQWYWIAEPRTLGANETPNQLLPIMRRPNQWGLYLRNRESEANAGVGVFELTASDASKKQFEFGTLQRRTWTHLAMVRDGNEIRTYVNGDLRNTYDVTGQTFTDADTNIVWGYDSSQSVFQGPMLNLRDFKVRSVAAYRDSFTVNRGSDNFDTTIPAANARGRGTSTHIFDSQTILSGLPNAFTEQVGRYELDKSNVNNFQHVEMSVLGSGQLEVTTRVDDEWRVVESPIVAPGFQQRRIGNPQFGKFVSINKDRLVVGAPMSPYTGQSGEYNPSATGTGYVFDTTDNFRYKTKVVQRSNNSIAFAGRTFGNSGIDDANRIALFDLNFGTREIVFFNLMYGSGTNYNPANVKKLWSVETTGRMTSLTMFETELLARKTTAFKSTKIYTTGWPASAVAYTASFGSNYSSEPSGVSFPQLTLPLQYLGDQLFYSVSNGARTNPDWDTGNSGFIAPLVYNGLNEYTYEQTFFYPGSLNANKGGNDYVGYDVKTNGVDIFVSAIGGRSIQTNNVMYTNLGNIHRYQYSTLLEGWDEKELILPSTTTTNQFFGTSFDIKGDYLIAKTTGTTAGVEVFKKGAEKYEFVERFLEGTTNDPNVFNSARFFSTEANFITGSPDGTSGTKTGVGYGRHYVQDVDGTYNSDGIDYKLTNVSVDDRVVEGRFGTSLVVKDGRVVIGIPQYNKINGGTSTRTNMGAATIFEKNEDGVWVYKALLSNSAIDGSSQFWGSRVSMRGNRILLHSNSATSAAATYTFDGTTATFEGRITNSSRGMIAGGLVSDTKFVGGNPIWTPTASLQLAAGSFTDFNFATGAWAKGTDNVVPQHTNGAYEYGAIAYGSTNNVSLGRNANDAFGTSVGLNAAKNLLQIGAPGHTYLIDPTASTNSGAGAVFTYYLDTNTNKWRLNTKLTASIRSSFGAYGRGITSTSGDFIISGAFSTNNNGSIYRLRPTGTGISTTWNEAFTMTGVASLNSFGAGVAYDTVRDLLYVGSPLRGVNSITSGLFETVTTASVRTAYTNEGNIRNRNALDQFGYSVAVHNGAIAVGVIGYDYDMTGTVAASNRGAVYTFKLGAENLFEYDQKITFETYSTITNNGAFVGLNDDYLFVGNSREAPVVFKRNENGKFGAPLTTTAAPTLTASALVNQTRTAWDKVSMQGVVSAVNGTFNVGTPVNFGAGIPINYNSGNDSFAVANVGVVTQIVNANGVVEPSHVVQPGNPGYGQTGIALSPDGSMLAVASYNDTFNLSNTILYTVSGQNVWGKVFVYRWNARKNMFEYHSIIVNPVSNQSQTTMGLSWNDGKLAVTIPNTSRTFIYGLVDDRFWKLETTATMENTLTSAVLTLEGKALVMAKPTSAGYPSVANSGSLRTRILNENVWGSSRGIHAGADGETYAGASSAGGGGGAGYLGGNAGGVSSASGGQGGSNLLPVGGSQILSLGATRANPTHEHATGAGGNTEGAAGEDARVVLTYGTTTEIFNYTGIDQTFTVPTGVTEITVSLWGAGGGAAQNTIGWSSVRSSRGGAGAFVTGTISVVEGEQLKIVVGGGGAGGSLASGRANRAQDRKYGFGGLGGLTTNANIDTAGCGGGLAGIARGDEYLAIAGGGGGGSTRDATYTLDGRPGGYDVLKDVARVLETLPDSDLVQAPGIINSRMALDYFGYSVGIKDENQIYVGSPGHSYDTSGDPLPTGAGAVFEYKRINGKWQLVQKIVSSKATAGQNFGFGLDLTNDKMLVLGSRLLPSTNYTIPTIAGFTTNNTLELFANDGTNYLSEAIVTVTGNENIGISATIAGDKVVFGNPLRLTDGAKPSVSAGGFTTYDVIAPNLTNAGSIVGDGVSYGRIAGDLFGAAVEITPTQIIVGAPGHDYGNNGINYRPEQGAIYVFDKKGAAYGYREKINLEPESELLGFGRSLKLIGDKLYAGTTDASAFAELTVTNGAWTIARHIEAGVGKIAEIVNDSKLVELDSTAAQGVGTQPDLAGAGRAKTFTINPDGTLTDANMDYSVPGRSNGRNPGDQFGYSVYANHDFVVVGAPGHSFDLIGNPISKSGSLFVFNKTGDKWNIESKIAPDETAPIGFGRSLSGRNGWIITGNFDDTTGFARVIQRVAEGNWVARKDYTGAGETAGRYGASVAAADTNKFVVGIPDANNVPGSPAVEKSGIVEAYERVGEDWFNRGTFSALGLARGRNAGDWFGYSMSANRNYLVIGSPQYDYDITGDLELSNSGAIWIYLKNSQFPMVAKFTSPTRIADGRFGETVGIEEKTNTVVVGEPGANAVHIFAFDGETLTLTQTLTATLDAGEVFGKTLAVNAGHIAVGSAMASTDADGENPMTNAGATYVYALDASTGIWSLKEKIAGFTNEVGDLLENGRVAEDVFGTAVALDSKGSLIIGAPGHDYDVLGENPVDGSGAVFIKKIN